MSSPEQMNISFRQQGIDYHINLVQGKRSDQTVEINGITYAVLGDEEKLETACKILASFVSLDSITNEKDHFHIMPQNMSDFFSENAQTKLG